MIDRSKIYLSDRGIYLVCFLSGDLDKAISQIKELYPGKSDGWYNLVRGFLEDGTFSELSEGLINKLYEEYKDTRDRFLGFDRR